MRRAILLLIALSMLVCMFACKKPDTPQNDASEKMLEKDESIVIRTYGMYCDGPIFRHQYLKDCDEAYALIELLNNAKKTGQAAMKISDDVIDESKIRDYPVELGTSWIEIADRIYRISHDDTQIWLVTSHFGEGEELEMTTKLKKAIDAAWSYSPYYTYEGVYVAGDETVELEVENEGDSPIRMSIKSIGIQETYPCENRIAVELTSSEDIETLVILKSQQSSGNIGGSDSKMISLKKGVPQTVELQYVGFPYSHWVYISAESTSVGIHIAELIRASEGLPRCVSVRDDKYYLTLPDSKTELEFKRGPYDFTKYAPFITDLLVNDAEGRIAYELLDYDRNSGFYLTEKDNVLYLTAEVIKELDEPNERGEDHEHVFFTRRISKRIPE